MRNHRSMKWDHSVRKRQIAREVRVRIKSTTSPIMKRRPFISFDTTEAMLSTEYELTQAYASYIGMERRIGRDKETSNHYCDNREVAERAEALTYRGPE